MLVQLTTTAAVVMAAVIHPQSPVFLGFFFSARHRSETMRAPGNNISGWVARRLMTNVNKETSVHVVKNFLDVQPDQSVVELGPGSGYSLRPILASGPRTVAGIEISPSFRDELASSFTQDIAAGKLHIHSEDAAAYMKKNMENASVDRILGNNVVYFLNPLKNYLEECYRVLKPGGMVVFSVKDMVKTGDPAVFVNKDWDECILAMKQAGFDAKKHPLQMNGPAEYWPLVGIKK